jgi:hypothetical protein
MDIDIRSAIYPTSNFPAPGQDAQGNPSLAFDAATDESVDFTFTLPQDYASGPSLVIYYRMASATTGAVRWQVQVEAITPGDAVDTDATSSFDTANSNGATVPGTAGYVGSITVTLTNADSMAAGDRIRLRLNRDADGTSGTDDAAGDAQLLNLDFLYTAA